MSKKSPLVLAAAALCGFSVSAFALTVQPFEIHWAEGPLASTISVGSFSYDESLLGGDGDGEEGLTVLNPEHGLFSFDVVVEDATFTMEDDEEFPEFPIVEFDDVEPVFVDYFAILDDDEIDAGPSLDLFGFVGIADDEEEFSAIFFPKGFIMTDDEDSLSTVTSSLLAEPIVIEEPSFGVVVLTSNPVPETGATMILMGISLVTLSVFRRGQS